MKVWLLFISLFFQPLANAERLLDGGQEGNGGDVVVCRNADRTIRTIELLDYYEARVQRGIKVQLPDVGTPETIAKNALATVREFSKVRGNRYDQFIRDFMTNAHFVDALVDVPDSKNIVIADGCEVEQLIVNQKVEFPEDKRFLINKNLWNKMSAGGQAGAILHEAFYSEALANGAKNSRTARYFHSKMVSNNADQMSDVDYLRTLRLTKFSDLGFRNLFAADSCPLSEVPEEQLVFSTDGLLEVVNWACRYKLIVPLISFLDPLNIRRLSLERGQTGYRIEATIGEKTRAVIKKQRLELAADSILTLNHDQSIELQLVIEANNCYVDPDGHKSCGQAMVLDAGGQILNVRDGLDQLQLSNWEFHDPGGQVRWTFDESGRISFTGTDAFAFYRSNGLYLHFPSLEDLQIVSGRPMPSNTSTRLDATSSFLGIPLGQSPLLVSKEENLASSGVVALWTHILIQFDKPATIKGIVSRRWEISEYGSISVIPQNEPLFGVSDSARSSREIRAQAGKKIEFPHRAFTVSKKFKSIRVICENGNAVVRAGDHIQIYRHDIYPYGVDLKINEHNCRRFHYKE